MFLRKNNDTRTKVSADQDGVWSDEKRIEAVACYISLGSIAEVSRVTGIPQNTLWSWKKYSLWWKDVESTLRNEKNNGTAAKLTGIVDKTLAAIIERIEEGDYIYNQRTGEIARVAIPASALNKIASTLLDRKLLLEKMEARKEEETEGDSTERLNKQLSNLASAFRKFVDKKTREEKVIEHIPT